MSEWLSQAADWLARAMMAGGSVLLIAWLFMAIVRQPIRRRMIGDVGVRVALLAPLLALGPQWLRVELPAEPTTAAQPAPSDVVARIPVPRPIPIETAGPIAPDDTAWVIAAPMPESLPAPAENPAADVPEGKPADVIPLSIAEPGAEPIDWSRIALVAYAAGAMVFGLRWLSGLVAARAMIWRSRPASESLVAMFRRCVPAWVAVPELRVASGLTAPVCGGLFRRVVLLPQRLAEAGDEESLRWVFAHELAHLKNGDAWTACWFGLAAILYYPLPWYWLLRRRVELCQEYVADAEAAAQSRPEEYAAFLVGLSRSARHRRRPAGIAGVLGTPSELYRRIAMLLNDKARVDRVCPRRWSLLAAGALLSAAVLFAGFGLNREAAADEKKPDDKPPPAKGDEDPKKPAEDEKFVKPRPGQPREFPFAPGGQFNPEELDKYMRKMMEEMMKRMQQGGLGPNVGGAFIGPRGMTPFGAFARGQGRLGAMVEAPSAVLVEQLDLPKNVGIVLTEIQADSAAAKAGLKANDILLEIGGKPVPSEAQEFRDALKEIKADTAVDAVVLRKGKRETIKGLKLPEVKEDPFGGFGGFRGVPQALVDPPIPPAPPVPGFPGGATKSTQIQINNGSFSLSATDDDLNVSVTGTIEDGKLAVNKVFIKDGDDSVNVDKLDDVPAKYKAKVNELLKSVKVGGPK